MADLVVLVMLSLADIQLVWHIQNSLYNVL